MSQAEEPRVVTVGQGRRDYVPGVALEWLADANLTPGSQMTFGRAQFEPGSSNPVHYHPNCHELVFVAEGTIEHMLGSQTVTLSAGSLLHVPQGVRHRARNIGDGVATLLVAFSSEARQTVFLDDSAA